MLVHLDNLFGALCRDGLQVGSNALVGRVGDETSQDVGLEEVIVAVERLVHDLQDSRFITGLPVAVERVVPSLEILLEERKDVQFPPDVPRDFLVSGKDVGKGQDGKFADTFEPEEFAEGEPRQFVADLPAGQIPLPGLELQHGRARIGDLQAREVVIEVLQDSLPVLHVVDFVEDEPRSAVLDEPFGQEVDFAGVDPDVVQGYVEGPVALVAAFANFLEKERRLSDASGALQAD